MNSVRARRRSIPPAASDRARALLVDASKRVDAIDFALEAGDETRAIRAAIALASALTRGAMHEAVARSARAFRDGADDDEDACAWAHLALAGRAAIHDALRARPHALVEHAARALDQAVAPHREALLLLSSREYADAARSLPLDADAWWSYPARLERAVPSAMLDRLLSRDR
jgi:hypothetical protein